MSLLLRFVSSFDWRVALIASLVAFVLRYGLWIAGVEVAVRAGLHRHITVNQAWVVTGLIAVASFAVASAVWWRIYKRIARPGKLWAKNDDQEGTANRMSGEGCEKPRTQERVGLPGFSEFAPAAQPN